MRTVLFVSVLCACVGCTSHDPPVVQGDWQSIEAEKAFTFKAPPDLQPEQVQGIDSFIGRYVSQSMTVSFDYGWYSDPMDREGFDRSSTTIDGRRAYIVRKSDVMGVHFPEVQGDTKLTMRAELHGADPETIETIFRTIDFPE